MSDQDVDVTEFVGWVVTTARLHGWGAVRSETFGISSGSGPDVILFGGDRVLAVNVKTAKATRATGARENGGLTESQHRVRLTVEASGTTYHLWTPNDAQEALSVLAAGCASTAGWSRRLSRDGRTHINGPA